MGYGSGTLYQRGKRAIWYYQAYVDGKQIGPISSKSTDRKVAQRELDELLGKRARGEIVHSRCDVNRLRKYRQERAAAGADGVTMNRELSYLRAAFRRALKDSAIGSVPYFPIAKEDNAPKGFQDEADFLRLLNELPNPLKPFACCGYYVGMRRGEMLRLDISDVDLAGGFVEIRKTKNKEAHLVPIVDGPMREWLEWAVQNRGAGKGRLLVSEDGRPFTERNFYHACTPPVNGPVSLGLFLMTPPLRQPQHAQRGDSASAAQKDHRP